MASKNIRGITIEIDGDTSKLGSALQDVEKQSRKTNTELRDIDKNLKFNPGNVELVSQQQRNLQKAISETKEKLEILQTADKQAKEQLANGEIGQDQYDALQREIIATEKYLESYEKRLDSSKDEQKKFANATGDIAKVLEGSGKNIEDFADLLGEDVVNAYKKGEGSSSQMQDALGKLAKEFENSGDDIKNYGVKFDYLGEEAQGAKEDIEGINDTAVSVVGLDSLLDLFSGLKDTIVDAAAAIQEAWAEIDEAQDTITAKTGATGDAQEKLGKVFDNVYRRMPVEAQAVGDAIGELNTQFGLQGEELELATEKLLQYSEINGTDVTQTTQQAKEMMSQFGLETEDLSKVLDVITKAGQDTGVSVDSLMSTMTDGAPVLQDMGLSFEESAVMLSEFEQNGINSSKALGFLTKAQASGAKDGKSLNQVLEEFNGVANSNASETEKLEAAAKLFGTRGGSMMLKAAKDGALNFDDLGNKAKGAEGKVTETYNNMLDPADTFVIAQNNIKTAFSDISNTVQGMLAPAFETLATWLQDLVTWFTNLPEGVKQAIVIFGAIVTALTTIAIVIGVVKAALAMAAPFVAALSTGFTAVGAAVGALFSPIGLLVAAIVAAVVIIATNWETVKQLAMQLWVKIQEVWSGIKTTISNAWTAVSNKTVEIWNGIKATLSNLWEGIKTTVTNAVNSVKESIANVWNSVKETTANVWNGIKSTISGVWSGIKTVVSNAVNSVRTTISNVFNSIKSTVSNIWNGIKNTTTNVWNGIKTTVSNVVDGVKNTVTNVFTGLKNTVTNIWNGIKTAITKPIESAKNTVKGIVDSIKGFFTGKWFKLEMPHFSISGSINPFSPNFPPKVGVDWYAQGGIFDKPSVIGVGEAGQEAVLPTHKLDKFLDEAVKRVSGQGQGSGITINIENANIREDSDIKKLADEVLRRIDLKNNRNKLAGGFL